MGGLAPPIGDHAGKQRPSARPAGAEAGVSGSSPLTGYDPRPMPDNRSGWAPINERKNIMNYLSTQVSTHAQPALPRGPVAQPANWHPAEPAGLTVEEIRRIVLDVLG
ncbi:hypothetical protein ACFQU7_09725 [Pseudoroseomonas wenyumeiae]